MNDTAVPKKIFAVDDIKEYIDQHSNRLYELDESGQYDDEFCQILNEVYYNISQPNLIDFRFHECALKCLNNVHIQHIIQHVTKFLSKYSLSSSTICCRLTGCGIFEKYCELFDCFCDDKIAKYLVVGFGNLCENNKTICRKLKKNGLHQRILSYAIHGSSYVDNSTVFNYISRYSNMQVSIEDIQDMIPIISDHITQETIFSVTALDAATSMISSNLLAISKPYFGRYLKDVIQLSLSTSTLLIKIEALHFLLSLIGLNEAKIMKYISMDFVDSYTVLFEPVIIQNDIQVVNSFNNDQEFVVDAFESFITHCKDFLYNFINTKLFDTIVQKFDSFSFNVQMAFSIIISDMLELKDVECIEYVLGNNDLVHIIDRALEAADSNTSLIVLKALIAMGRFAIDNSIKFDDKYVCSEEFSDALNEIELQNTSAETSTVCNECRALFFDTE